MCSITSKDVDQLNAIWLAGKVHGIKMQPLGGVLFLGIISVGRHAFPSSYLGVYSLGLGERIRRVVASARTSLLSPLRAVGHSCVQHERAITLRPRADDACGRTLPSFSPRQAPNRNHSLRIRRNRNRSCRNRRRRRERSRNRNRRNRHRRRVSVEVSQRRNHRPLAIEAACGRIQPGVSLPLPSPERLQTGPGARVLKTRVLTSRAHRSASRPCRPCRSARPSSRRIPAPGQTSHAPCLA